jgi:hypothetical protein
VLEVLRPGRHVVAQIEVEKKKAEVIREVVEKCDVFGRRIQV